jgi:hypothetical protein
MTTQAEKSEARRAAAEARRIAKEDAAEARRSAERAAIRAVHQANIEARKSA